MFKNYKKENKTFKTVDIKEEMNCRLVLGVCHQPDVKLGRLQSGWERLACQATPKSCRNKKQEDIIYIYKINLKLKS